MKLSDDLYLVHEREQHLGLQRLRRWSGYWGDWLLYVAFRSRGFVSRSTTNLLIELIETIGIAFCATVAMTRAAAMAVIVGFVLHGVFEGIFQAFRSAHLEGRNLSWRVHLIVCVSISIAVYSLTIIPILSHPLVDLKLLLLLFVCRATSAIVSQLSFSRVSEIALTTRIYFPPWINYALVALCSLLVLLTQSFSASNRFILIVLSATFIRVLGSVLMLKFGLNAERRLASRKTEVKEDKVFAFARNDLLRLLSAIAFYIVPAFLTYFRALDYWAVSATSLWLLLSLFSRSSERPLRAIYVDLYQAFTRKQWAFLASRLQLAFRTGIAFVLIGFVTCLFLLSGQILQVDLVLLFWILLAVLNHLYTLSKSAIAEDRKVISLMLVCKLVQVLLVTVLFSAHWEEYVALVLLLSEAFLSSAMWWEHRNFLTAHALEFSASQRVQGTEKSFQPAKFLGAYPVLSKLLENEKLESKLLLLKCTKTLRSKNLMERQIESIGKFLRNSDRLLALDSKTIFLWLPTADDVTPVLKRIYRNLPLDIESHELLDSKVFFALIETTRSAKLPLDLINSSPLVLCTFMELQIRTLLTEIPEGAWWAKDPSGDWVSLYGRAEARLAQALFAFESRMQNDVFPFRSQAFRERQLGRYLYPFRSLGKLSCIYVSHSSHDRLGGVLSELQKEFVTREDAYKYASPDAFFECQRLLADLADRRPMLTRLSKSPDLHTAELRVLSTQDGWGHPFYLNVKFSN